MALLRWELRLHVARAGVDGAEVAVEAAVQVESSQRRRKIEVLLQLEVDLVRLRPAVVLMMVQEAISRPVFPAVVARLDGGNLHHMQDVGYQTLPLEEVEESLLMVRGDYTSLPACSDRTCYL
jgi:hypothetical protein